MKKSSDNQQITLQHIADQLHLSLCTVSQAISGKGRVSAKTRERVRQVAQELGFEPNAMAQRLAHGGEDKSVALFALYLDLGVATRKLQLLQRALYERGYTAPIHAFGTDVGSKDVIQAELLRNLRRLRPRAIILYTMKLNDEAVDEARQYIQKGGHIITYDVPVDLDCDKVLFDRAQNTYAATRHLLDLGHKRIGFFVGSWPVAGNNPRLAGLKTVLAEFNVPLSREWLDFADDADNFDYRPHEDLGIQLAEYFLSLKKRPSAMCIVNDMTAASFVNTVRAHGLRVPEDVSVIGHDDLPFIETFGLTTVSHPVRTIANDVIELLMDRLEGGYDGPPRTRTVYGELRVRHSTAPHRSLRAGKKVLS
jgi:DNA-binding LacI/PurR family transcriptional regulator